MKAVLAKKLLSLLFIVSFFSVASFVFAQGAGQDPSGAGAGQNPASSSTSGTLNLNFSISNPIPGVDTLPQFIEKLLDIVMTVGIPVVAIFIIYAGFLFVKARGNEKDLQTAKDALLYALIGAAILLGAYVIAQAIQGTIEALQ